MAFSASNDIGSFCDKCGKRSTEEEPAISFIYSAGRGNSEEYHQINIHFSCLEKAVKKAEMEGKE